MKTLTQYLKSNGFKFGAGGFVHASGAWSVDTTGFCAVSRRAIGSAWLLCSIDAGRPAYAAEGNTVAELAAVLAGLEDSGRFVKAVAPRPAVQVVERWTGTEWAQVTLFWNGERYAELAAPPAELVINRQ